MKGHTMDEFENAIFESLVGWENYLDEPYVRVSDIEKFAYLRGWFAAYTAAIESRNK